MNPSHSIKKSSSSAAIKIKRPFSSLHVTPTAEEFQQRKLEVQNYTRRESIDVEVTSILHIQNPDNLKVDSSLLDSESFFSRITPSKGSPRSTRAGTTSTGRESTNLSSLSECPILYTLTKNQSLEIPTIHQVSCKGAGSPSFFIDKLQNTSHSARSTSLCGRSLRNVIAKIKVSFLLTDVIAPNTTNESTANESELREIFTDVSILINDIDEKLFRDKPESYKHKVYILMLISMDHYIFNSEKYLNRTTMKLFVLKGIFLAVKHHNSTAQNDIPLTWEELSQAQESWKQTDLSIFDNTRIEEYQEKFEHYRESMTSPDLNSDMTTQFCVIN